MKLLAPMAMVQYSEGNGPVDRIRDLPEHVILNILRHLPFLDALKTSLLSTRWRKYWLGLKQVVLDEEFFEAVLKTVRSNAKVSRYLYIVSNVLLRHIGEIQKFVLHIPLFPINSRGDLDLNQWIEFISRNGVKELVLSAEGEFNELLEPPSVYSCSSLTDLSLVNCAACRPALFSYLSCLTRLSLEFVDITSLWTVELLISSCPKLAILSLSMVHCRWSSSIRSRILIPSTAELRVFNVKSDFCVSFLGPTKIRTMSMTLGIGIRRLEFDASFLGLVLRNLPSVEKLDLNLGCCKLWSVGSAIPKRLPFELRELKCLKLGGRRTEARDWDPILLTLCLLRSSPNLQRLEVDVDLSAEDDEKALLNVGEDCWFEHLREVRLSGISGALVELQLIKCILSRCPALEVLHISNGVEAENRKRQRTETSSSCSIVSIIYELPLLHRASAKAEVIFDGFKIGTSS